MTAGSEGEKSRCGRKKPEGKHWLEYAIFVFVVATAFATAAAACYTRHQWLTAGDTEQRQLRAYVYVIPTDETSFSANAPASVGFVVKNDGQTPAFGVVAKHGLFTWHHPLLKTEGTFVESFDTKNSAYIFKDLTTKFTASTADNKELPTVPPQNLEFIKQGDNMRLYAIGIITYRDVFGVVHHTWFCYSYHGEGLARSESCDDPHANYGD